MQIHVDTLNMGVLRRLILCTQKAPANNMHLQK